MTVDALTPHLICRVENLPPGTRKIVEIGHRSIGVFNVGGRIIALRNRCPHRGAPLCEGRLTGLVTSEEPYALSLQRDGEILRCLWHGWEFDLLTGMSIPVPDELRVKTYHAAIEAEPCRSAVEKYDTTEGEGWIVVWLPSNDVPGKL